VPTTSPDPPVDATGSPEPDRVAWIIRQVLPFVVLGGMGAIAVRRGVAPLSNDDTFFHLRFGHEFLTSGHRGHRGR